MSKTLSALLIVFFITFSLFVYTKFFYLKSHPSKSAAVTQQAHPLPETNLLFFPNPLITQASDSAQLNVILDNNKASDLVQLELGFDPTALFNVQINFGDYFINPEVVLYNIDIKNGRISYGITGEPNPTSTQTVAVITFNTYNYDLQKKETRLTFLPKTLVRKDGEEIKLKSTQATKIIY